MPGKESEEYGGMHYRPKYCPKHNVIVLALALAKEHWTEIVDIAIHVINHETIHWLLCRDFDEEMSMRFDEVPAMGTLI